MDHSKFVSQKTLFMYFFPKFSVYKRCMISSENLFFQRSMLLDNFRYQHDIRDEQILQFSLQLADTIGTKVFFANQKCLLFRKLGNISLIFEIFLLLYLYLRYSRYTARKTIFSFSGRPEKMVFPKKLRWNMIFLVLSGKMIFPFPENMILHLRRKMKDDIS